MQCMAFALTSLWKPKAQNDLQCPPTRIIAQMLALQNLANVSRSNYIYLEAPSNLPPAPPSNEFKKPSACASVYLRDTQCR